MAFWEAVSFCRLVIWTVGSEFAGKVHGSLARAGKVRSQTPKVAKAEKKKNPKGRAAQRVKYNRRFVNVVTGFGKAKGPNSNPTS